MSNVVLYMSVSVDGFIAGPNDGPGQGLGVGGECLHDWLSSGGVDPASHRPVGGPSATVFDELMATGAVITGRRTFEFAGGWDGDHHDGVPIFVLTHAAPAEPAPGHARYVTDGIESCVAQAKAAAGDRDILLHGAAVAQECLRTDLLDEMELQLVPVLLGQGRRLFEGLVFLTCRPSATRRLQTTTDTSERVRPRRSRCREHRVDPEVGAVA
ncbi:MAG: dihydrofolate reductase [Catenulispora sp.]|nr:dihydrofolate reductase [Catenulispora sp.]